MIRVRLAQPSARPLPISWNNRTCIRCTLTVLLYIEFTLESLSAMHHGDVAFCRCS